jgi:hypothetical protein
MADSGHASAFYRSTGVVNFLAVAASEHFQRIYNQHFRETSNLVFRK